MKPQFGDMLSQGAAMGPSASAAQGAPASQDPDIAILHQIAADVTQIKQMLQSMSSQEQQEGVQGGQ